MNEPKNVIPICPHCKREPCALGMSVVRFGDENASLPVAVFTCGGVMSEGCRKIISVAPLPFPPVMPQMPEQEKSLIVAPFGA